MNQRLRQARWLGLRVSAAGLLLFVALPACVGSVNQEGAKRPPVTSSLQTVPASIEAPPLPGPVAAAAKPSSQGLGILKVAPENGAIGTSFTLTGENLPPNKDVELHWSTAQTGYLVDAASENVQYLGRKQEPLFVVLGHARTDAAGKLNAPLTIPDDFGNLHDIYAVADGIQLAKGGILVNRTASISPTEGPVGTPITIKLAALGWLPYESSTSLLYDNKYMGYISSTTTRGHATVQIRAAGAPGVHTIELDPASHAMPFLDVDQSATYYNRQFRFTFRITGDAGAPKPSVDWPVQVESTVPIKTAAVYSSGGATATLSSKSGPILSDVVLTGRGLTPSAPVELNWVTAEGTRATSSGWGIKLEPLQKLTAGADGSLTANLKIPDNLGGWHSVQLFQDGSLRASVPYYVTQSLVSVTPDRVAPGEVFHIRLKGVGWTELDNGMAVVYDNGYIGYACGFFSKGDIDLKLVATGGPGTHLVDIYPMIYKGKANDLWNNQVPMLSYERDNPGLPYGYRLPAFRVAIVVA